MFALYNNKLCIAKAKGIFEECKSKWRAKLFNVAKGTLFGHMAARVSDITSEVPQAQKASDAEGEITWGGTSSVIRKRKKPFLTAVINSRLLPIIYSLSDMVYNSMAHQNSVALYTYIHGSLLQNSRKFCSQAYALCIRTVIFTQDCRMCGTIERFILRRSLKRCKEKQRNSSRNVGFNCWKKYHLSECFLRQRRNQLFFDPAKLFSKNMWATVATKIEITLAHLANSIGNHIDEM